MEGSAVSVCLVHTPCRDLHDDRLEPPLGLLYLATLARRHGYAVRVLDLAGRNVGPDASDVPDGFDVYGFSTYSANYHVTQRIMRAARRRNRGACFVAGGPHATALPDQVASDGFDVVVRGEGELALLQILKTVERGDRPPSRIDGEPPRLDDLPHPDYDLIDLDSYSRQVNGHRCVSVISSRGCPCQCVFCNSTIMGAGKPIRYRQPADVIREIRELRQRYGIRHFRFQDDVFTISVRRVASLTALLIHEQIVYRCFARVGTCSRTMAELLRAGGCVHASFGVETGSRKLLSQRAMHKGQTPEQIRRGLENAHAAGLKTRIYLIVGFPGETDQTIEETLALARSCPWDEFSVYPLIAYPGTPLHDEPERFGITHVNRHYPDYFQIGRDFRAGFTIRTATFDEGMVQRWRDYVIRELLDAGRAWAGSSTLFR